MHEYLREIGRSSRNSDKKPKGNPKTEKYNFAIKKKENKKNY